MKRPAVGPYPHQDYPNPDAENALPLLFVTDFHWPSHVLRIKQVVPLQENIGLFSPYI